MRKFNLTSERDLRRENVYNRRVSARNNIIEQRRRRSIEIDHEEERPERVYASSSTASSSQCPHIDEDDLHSDEPEKGDGRTEAISEDDKLKLKKNLQSLVNKAALRVTVLYFQRYHPYKKVLSPDHFVRRPRGIYLNSV
ncbi:uncharacterized protein [Parasteatoda tepidariorum]|uniref:uncharacterized protein n=1 Tax=Parasteatoda tepidariorum TaxID=114398 RepID=UPI001C722BC5|nr:uncharacterized protein LOC122268708 [Parasteatoda tepidariorum]